MDSSSSAATATSGDFDLSSNGGGIPLISSWVAMVSRRYQQYLDKTTPCVLRRWITFAVVALIYLIRVFLLEGFYIVSYGLGIYILNLFIAFLSPQVDPETQQLLEADGPFLPTRASDEFRPFVRRLPEFKFWHGCAWTMFLRCPIMPTIYLFIFKEKVEGRCYGMVFHDKSICYCFHVDLLQCFRCACILAYSAFLLGDAIHSNNEASDTSYD